MKSAKHRYYEALDRQTAAERVLERNLSMGGDNMQERSYTQKEERTDEFRSLDTMYQELGIKAFAALTNCLDLFGKMGSQGASRSVDTAALEKVIAAAIDESSSTIIGELREIRMHLDQWEARFNSIEAGMKRIDRFTIDAFRELEEIKREADESRGGESMAGDRGRLAKEDAARLALEAGFRMREQGKRLTLASVAREAGLKYGQIVYAFGNKEAFFSQLEKDLHDHATSVQDRAV